MTERRKELMDELVNICLDGQWSPELLKTTGHLSDDQLAAHVRRLKGQTQWFPEQSTSSLLAAKTRRSK